MFQNFDDYKKQHDFVLCIDSDGTAIDTMDIKHKRCFGPKMLDVFELKGEPQAILDRWNEINLYSLTRGINRFKGLAMALTEIDAAGQKIEDLQSIQDFAENSPELSNAALKRRIEENPSPGLLRALEWSNRVNEAIQALRDDEKVAFTGVKACIEKASAFADIVILSSANREAVTEEWAKEGLLDHVCFICAQDICSKAEGIRRLLEKGYAKDHVLMLGDAPVDLEAAKKNEVFYYPILVRYENQSWAELKDQDLERFAEGRFAERAKELERAFTENLSA